MRYMDTIGNGVVQSAAAKRISAGSGDRPAVAPAQGHAHRSQWFVFYAHAGASMTPTLQALDLLEVVPYGDKPIRVGDVVVLRSPEGKLVAHRVVSVGANGIRTRGDGRPDEDAWNLVPVNVDGRVVAAWRGQERRPIHGGLAGLLLARIRAWRLALDRRASVLLRPLYRAIARRGARRLLPARWRPRVVVFGNGQHARWQVLISKNVVGHYDALSREWRIRRPFRLVVDDDVLPPFQE